MLPLASVTLVVEITKLEALRAHLDPSGSAGDGHSCFASSLGLHPSIGGVLQPNNLQRTSIVANGFDDSESALPVENTT